MKKLILKRLIRIYTPFICTLIALIHGVLFLTNNITDSFQFNSSAFFGFSIATIAYFWATSARMCIWWYINLLSLLLVIITSLLYYYHIFSFDIYLYATVIFSSIGLLAFIIYRKIVGITKILCY